MARIPRPNGLYDRRVRSRHDLAKHRTFRLSWNDHHRDGFELVDERINSAPTILILHLKDMDMRSSFPVIMILREISFGSFIMTREP
jgi:hypothetical protein